MQLLEDRVSSQYEKAQDCVSISEHKMCSQLMCKAHDISASSSLRDADPIQLTYQEMKEKSFTEKKIAVYLYHIKEFLYTLDKPIDDITQSDIDGYLQSMLMETGGLNYIISDSLKLFFETITRSNPRFNF